MAHSRTESKGNVEGLLYYSARSLRRKRPTRYLVGIFIGLAAIAYWWRTLQQYGRFSHSLLCQNLPGAHDVVVVMKTGATEFEDRFPVHLRTTLRCPPNVVIFSDHEELYEEKYEIRDVLANIDPAIRRQNSDFELYRLLKTVGRQGLQPSDVTGARSSSKTTKEEKVLIGGWVLDKWKFLPMMLESLKLYPRHKWYVFMESDTFLFWSTTLQYVSMLDHNEPHILGHRSTVKSEHPFMHGGSGYILSHAALKSTVEYIQANQKELDEFVESEWAGDIALGLVFKEAGLPLTASWPIYQPHYFGSLNYGLNFEDKRFWCYPAGSYHHMTPDDIEDLWAFEQNWLQDQHKRNDPSRIIHHGDVFSNLLLARMRFPRFDWNNECTAIRPNTTTSDDCEAVCIDDAHCVQYMFDTQSMQCTTLESVRLGESKIGSGLYSGWIFERVERWRNQLPPCHGESFILPEIEA